MLKIIGLILTLIIVAPVYAIDGTALLKQVDRNLNPESYESYRKLINIEPDGRKKEYTLFTVKKEWTRLHLYFLRLQAKRQEHTQARRQYRLYIPNVAKPIRITSIQSVVGGVFNNADILQLDYAAEYNVEKVDETGSEYLLFLKAKTKAVAYDRLKIWADKAKKLPTKIECLTEASMLIKTLYFKDIKDFGSGLARPSVIETDSPLYKGYKSVMIFAKVKEKNFKDEVFTLTFMPNIESLR